MKFLEKLKNLTANQNFGILVGNFDGVHRGHQFIISSFVECCALHSCLPVIITFNPHPIFIKEPTTHNFLIMSYGVRNKKLEKFCNYIEVKFEEVIMNTSGLDFLKNIFELENMRLFFAGHDFALGANKSFDFDEVKKIAPNYNVKAFQADVFVDKNAKGISSSEVRKLIKKGDIQKANEYLGESYAVSGKIISGKQLGRKIGFPTYNLQIPKEMALPLTGVYAGKVHLDKEYRAAINIGRNPTTDSTRDIKVEVYLLDYDNICQDTNELCIYFHCRIRDEKKFEDLNDLKEQISLDVEKIRKLENL